MVPTGEASPPRIAAPASVPLDALLVVPPSVRAADDRLLAEVARAHGLGAGDVGVACRLEREFAGALQACVLRPGAESTEGGIGGSFMWLATSGGWVGLEPATPRDGRRWVRLVPVAPDDLGRWVAEGIGGALS